jgi:hypothetical protein
MVFMHGKKYYMCFEIKGEYSFIQYLFVFDKKIFDFVILDLLLDVLSKGNDLDHDATS